MRRIYTRVARRARLSLWTLVAIIGRMEHAVHFDSAGLRLNGTLHLPDDAGRARPALVICHGFGGNSSGADRRQFALAFERAGYVVLRFDFRGCGASEGEPGRVICMEEVEDLRHALSFLQSQPGVDAARIGVIGGSLGGSVAIYAAALDERIRACVANGAIGDGERRFRFQYPDPAQWQRFLARLEAARRERARTGRPVMMDRFDIVAIPEARRTGLSPGARLEFPAETAISMLEFRPEVVVRRIAPRPLLLTHPRGDEVVPASESQQLAAAAGEPCELRILESADHFSSGDPVLQRIVLEWLARHLQPTEVKA
jgi:pimeloyl-ACP methyl ester carboxylesterase